MKIDKLSLKKDIKIAKDIASHFLKTPIIFCKPIGNGSNNKNYLVKSNKMEIVVKLSFDHKEYKAYQDYIKEKWCIEKSSKKGVSGPKVLGLGKYKGRAYMIETFVMGVNGKKLKNKLHLYKELGKYTKLIHSIKTFGFGEDLSNPKDGIFKDSWKRYLDYNIKSLTIKDKLLKLKVINIQQSKIIKDIFIELAKHKFNFGLCHGDVATWNTLVEKSGKVNLLDWGCAESHIVPHFDFATILWCQSELHKPTENEFKSFIHGYGISRTDFNKLKPILFKIMLLISIDKLRWAIDRNPSKIKEFTAWAKKMIRLNKI